MKFSEYFTYDKADRAEEVRVKGRVLKNLYKKVRIPWFLIIVGAFLAVFNGLVILSQYDNYQAIFTGALQDLSPLWQYLAASFIQYILIFASILADVAFITIITGVRKKLWRKILHLPMKIFHKETPSGMLSRVTSDAEYAGKPFAAAIAVLQILIYIMSLSAAAPKDMPQALGFLIVTLILAIASIVVSVKICSQATTFVQSRISALTAHYSEQLANNFTYIIIYSCAFLGGIVAIRQGAISDTTPISAIYAFGMALELTLVAIMTLPSYFAATIGGSKKLVSIFREPEEDVESGEALASAEGDIRLENVSFAYTDRPVVQELSALIPQGKVTAIVGPNGSGKSTVSRLIDRIYRKNGDPGNRRYPVDAGRIGFGIGPHVNAAGRMEDASLGVRLFLAKTPEEAYPYVEKMRTLNEERKSIQDRTERHILAYCAEELEHDLFPVLVPQTSHEGTNGVVAGRLRERFHKPVAILAGSQEEYYTATCRGIEGLDLHAVLSTQSHLFERFGGHAMACGFTIRKEYVSALKEGLEAVMKKILLAQPSLFEKHVPYDMILQPEQIDLPLAEELQLLAPFGKDNPNPAFLLESVKLQEYDVIGNGRALRLRIASAHGGVAGICFGSEEKISKLAELCRTADRLQITAHIDINEFNGRKSVQLMIVDISENKQE